MRGIVSVPFLRQISGQIIPGVLRCDIPDLRGREIGCLSFPAAQRLFRPGRLGCCRRNALRIAIRGLPGLSLTDLRLLLFFLPVLPPEQEGALVKAEIFFFLVLGRPDHRPVQVGRVRLLLFDEVRLLLRPAHPLFPVEPLLFQELLSLRLFLRLCLTASLKRRARLFRPELPSFHERGITPADPLRLRLPVSGDR